MDKAHRKANRNSYWKCR